MKKFFILVLVAVVAWAGVGPAHAAPMAQAPEPVIECDEDEVTDGQCTQLSDTLIMLEMQFHYDPANEGGWRFGWFWVREEADIYYLAEWSTGFTNGSPWWTNAWAELGLPGAVGYDGELEGAKYMVGAGSSVTIEGSISQVSTSPVGIGHYFANGTYGEEWDVSESGSGSFILYVSAEPISDCEDEYITLTKDTYEIIPTIETPLGPEGDPADDQIYPTVSGHVYQIEVSGGPWNDGTDDRDDLAISWDGETWEPLVDAPVCVSQNTDGDVKIFYVAAESETFYIRVNDTEGDFADNIDNPDPMVYAIALTTTTVTSCESQYTYDEFEDVVGFTGVAATDEDGVLANNADIPLVVGEWYVLQWDTGYWQDNGGPDQIDLEYWDSNANDWVDLAAGSSAVWCVSTDGLSVLIQAHSTELIIRVNNVTGTFAANTGTPYYTLYHAAFTRTPSDCEQAYQIGDLIEHRIVDADKSGGEVFASIVGGSEIHLDAGLTPGAWYVLDTTDGPWWTLAMNPNYRYDMAVSEDNGSTWGPLEEWATPSCNIPLDTLGHRRVVFQMPSSGEEFWKLRVDGTVGFFTNQGSMEWDLYGAVELQNTLPGGGCDYSYNVEDVIAMGTVQGDDEIGVTLNGLEPGNVYAIKIVGEGYGWQEYLLGDDLFDMQLSHNGGLQWYSLPFEYPPLLCHEASGDDLFLYVQPGDNYDYRLRVDSSTFANNTGEMGYVVYSAQAGETIINTCLDGWSLQVLNGFDWIDVRDEQGEMLSSDTARYEEFVALVPGRSYLVETPADQGPWGSFDALSTQRWDTALSPDNGVNWEPISFDSVFVDCVDYDAVGHVWRAKFTAQEGDVWKIRVNDTAGNFANNTGNMAYKFYVLCEGMACTGSLPNDSTTNGIPAISIQGGGDVCKLAIIRPSSLLDVGGWLQYLNLSLLRYMAWCPRHTSILMTFMNRFREHEPLATIAEWNDNIGEIKNEIESYDWGENSGQAESIFEMTTSGEFREKVVGRIFVKGTSDVSIWEGGQAVDFSDGSLPPSYSSCSSAFIQVLPSGLVPGVCFVSAYFIETSASFWIQLMVDIAALFLLFRIMKKSVQEVVYMMTGVKPWTASGSDLYPYMRGDKSLTAQKQEQRDDVATELESRFGRKFRKNKDGTFS